MCGEFPYGGKNFLPQRTQRGKHGGYREESGLYGQTFGLRDSDQNFVGGDERIKRVAAMFHEGSCQMKGVHWAQADGGGVFLQKTLGPHEE